MMNSEKLNINLPSGINKFSRGNDGFTILEILIASAISSLILLMISTSYKSILKSIEDITGYSEFYENVNMTIYRIDKDISNTYFKLENKKICFIGDSEGKVSTINFVTVNHADMTLLADIKKEYHKSDVREVGYSLLQSAKKVNTSVLMRREQEHYDNDPEKGGELDIILENVTGITFEFKLGNDWTKKWDSRINMKLPEAVRTTMTVKNYQNIEEKFVFISYINMK